MMPSYDLMISHIPYNSKIKNAHINPDSDLCQTVLFHIRLEINLQFCNNFLVFTI